MSIIEPTEEMHGIATDTNPYGVVEDLIEVIERDYIVQPRCPEIIGVELRCNLPAGHGYQHRAKLANGNEITFENLVDISTDVV